MIQIAFRTEAEIGGQRKVRWRFVGTFAPGGAAWFGALFPQLLFEERVQDRSPLYEDSAIVEMISHLTRTYFVI